MSCTPHPQTRTRTNWLILGWVLGLSLLLTACAGTSQAKTYTIGVVNYSPVLAPVFDSFKARMGELGYVEGTNVTYIYHGLLKNDPQVIDTEVKSLLDQKVDMFLTMGTPTTLSAKRAVDGTGIPVVFAPVINPVAEGAVTTISRPGGNVTGIQSINTAPKALEWLLKIVPGTKQIAMFYNPVDQVSVTTLKPLPEAAAQLGLELTVHKVSSPEEVLAIMQTLPKGTAILLVPAPSLESGRSAIEKLATERGIPAAGVGIDDTKGLIFTYTTRFAAQGQQAAGLADQIFKGTKPADLPVETGDYFLTINLKIANALGLNISDAILGQANTVIR